MDGVEERMASWHRALHAAYELEAKQERQFPFEHRTRVPDSSAYSAEERQQMREFYDAATLKAMRAYNNLTKRLDTASLPPEEPPPDAEATPRPLAFPLGRREARFRVVVAAMEVGWHSTRLAPLGFALRDLAELCALALPGRSLRANEAWPSDPPLETETTTTTTTGWTRVADRAKRQTVLPAEAQAYVDSPSWRTLVARGPFVVVGHGALGGIFAYEVVRAHLRRHGRPPKNLVVSACRAPGAASSPIDGGPPLTDRSDEALLAYFAALRRGTSPETNTAGDEDIPSTAPDFESNREREQRLQRDREARDQRRRRAHLSSLPAPLRECRPLRVRAAACHRADLVLLESHAHHADWPLPCPITALAGQADPAIADADLDEWRAETDAGFEVRRAPGAATYLDHPAGQVFLADVLRRIMTEATLDENSGDDAIEEATVDANEANPFVNY